MKGRTLENQRGNSACIRNARLAAIKAFMRYVEFQIHSALNQIRQIHAILLEYLKKFAFIIEEEKNKLGLCCVVELRRPANYESL